MLRVNRKTDYAIRFLLCLAKRPAGTRLSTDFMRREMLVPGAIAQQIIAGLAHGGFVVTFPGRNGGVQLARPATQISLLQVLEHFEGPVHISDCLTDRLACPLEGTCVVQGCWDHVRRLVRDELGRQDFDLMACQTRATETLDGSIRARGRGLGTIEREDD